MTKALAATLAASLLCAAPAARAVLPDEIQVYIDDLDEAGRYSLQLHVNATPEGKDTPDYPGEVLAEHGVRATAEFAYGLGHDLEAGAYLPVDHDSSGATHVAGFKLRLKWVPLRPPEDGTGWFAGLNGEISQVQQRYESDRRGFELRPIVGWRDANWLLAANPVLEFALAGPDGHHAPSFAPSFKIARTVAPGVQIGPEYYADLGRFGDFDTWGEQQHTLYLALDIDRKPWNVNFGVGRGLTGATDRWTVKMIIDIPLPQ